MLARNPAKRTVERYWLRFTPVWGVIVGLVMLSGWAERWGDAELMALNANPFMAGLFCFDDLGLMLTLGTFSYGTALAAAMPVWVGIDERQGESTPVGRVVVQVLAAMMVIVVLFEVYRYGLAPYFTTVEPGAMNLRDFADSCLQASPHRMMGSP